MGSPHGKCSKVTWWVSRVEDQEMLEEKFEKVPVRIVAATISLGFGQTHEVHTQGTPEYQWLEWISQ